MGNVAFQNAIYLTEPGCQICRECYTMRSRPVSNSNVTIKQHFKPRGHWFMGKRLVSGSLVFLVGLFAGVHREPAREPPLYGGVCASDVRTLSRLPRLALDILQRVSAQSVAPQPVSCAAPPTTYQSLPSVTGRGDVSVPLSLGTGPGIGTDNPNLCFVYKTLPAAPVIRIKQGNTLTINLTNTLDNTGP